ncbi:hypothetical protein GTO89_13265 [Heliobacterium gestii]|uniref:L-2-amino-thiazoline-4-carboxylic acid hydrolase n=1 Tax=Heliomicrobium gestii TaxID=2699 RepID=A0A845LBF8_HELGE|nr:L-2-amino-thiazoline-4-carboxylic acid hydrolase [Heliomicrobium gestii]MBM7867608.1 hypothetical protein [Heliomicrobium gestii]MZP44002.1 hypothetical protein [Heliomicrobium gestii]
MSQSETFSLETVRQAFQDRATWFYLLLDEAQAMGVDAETLAKKAIFRYGQMKGQAMEPTAEMEKLIAQFARPTSQAIFEMKIVEVTPEQAVIEFHRCPLVDAWRERHGCDVKETDRLCDWAVQGDRGIMACFPDFEFIPEKRIGAGDACCRMVFRKKS